MSDKRIVDDILLAVQTGTKAEDEAVEEYGELLQCGLLDFQYLYNRDERLYQKVEEWCKANPPPL